MLCSSLPPSTAAGGAPTAALDLPLPSAGGLRPSQRYLVRIKQVLCLAELLVSVVLVYCTRVGVGLGALGGYLVGLLLK